MGGRPRILVVDDDPVFVKWLVSHLMPWGDIRVAVGAVTAMRELEDGRPWRAAVIDMCLPDGPGLGVAAALKRVHPDVPTLIVTGNLDLRPTNAAYLMGLAYLEKPIDPACLERFMSSPLAISAKVRILAREWQRRHRLTEAQQDILRRAALGEDRHTIAACRGSSPLTIKRQVADMLPKTGDESLHAAVERLLREAATMM
jgi:DNA-binding NarL/FixJ family response regulator